MRQELSLFAILICVLAAPSGAFASCPTCTNFFAGTPLGTSGDELTEASGIAPSRKNPGVVWTHNDGPHQRIYALGTNGALLANFDFNSTVTDIEDIAVGPGPATGVSYLYIGDIGGNTVSSSGRSSVKIVRIPEPAVDLAWSNNPQTLQFSGIAAFGLTYPDGDHDAESLLVDSISGDIFVATKQDAGAGLYRASLAGLNDGQSTTLEYLRTVPFDLASGGDISPDGMLIVLRREDFAMLWTRCDNEPINTAFARPGLEIPVIGPPTEPNGEGIGFLSDSSGYVTIGEGADPAIYFFKTRCAEAPKFTTLMSDASVFVGGMARFQVTASGFPVPTFAWFYGGKIFEGQSNSSLTLSNVTAADEGTYQVIASNAAGVVTNSATLTVRAKPDLRITEVESSRAASAGVPTADWWELTSFESQPVDLTGWRFNDDTGGLTDPFVFTNTLILAPYETVVFVEDLTPEEFRNWWGASNLPPDLQIVTYSGSGLSLSAAGDSVQLWTDDAVAGDSPVISVDFGAATAGVSFNFDPTTGVFGGLSQPGVNGVFQASLTTDIGSPGRILAPAVPPPLKTNMLNDHLRISFPVESGHHYLLETRTNLTTDVWVSTWQSFDATNDTLAFFDLPATDTQRYFRVRAE